MKKYIILLLIATSGKTFGQEAETNKTLAVKANIFPFLIDNNANESYYLFSTAIRVSAEKSISKNKSLVFELGYAGPLTFDVENGEAGENIATTGIISGFGTKFYFGNSSPMSGTYILPMANYSYIKLLEHPEGMPRTGYVGFKDIGLTGVLGYQTVCKKNWLIDFYAGTQIFQRNYYDNTYMENPTVINHNEIGIKPVVGISFGKSF